MKIICRVVKIISRVFEELFPFLAFLMSERRLKKVDNQEAEKQSASYSDLGEDGISTRIQEEHARAVKIDEKTSKFTLGLSVSLTVLAAASGAFAKYIPTASSAVLVSTACGVASIYMLLAGMTALGALKTMPTYGYGTQHLLKKRSEGVSYLRQALYAQERMNIVRQLRNESAYQSLRNGFFVLLVALVYSVVDVTTHQYFTEVEANKPALSNKGNKAAEKSPPVISAKSASKLNTPKGGLPPK